MECGERGVVKGGVVKRFVVKEVWQSGGGKGGYTRSLAKIIRKYYYERLDLSHMRADSTKPW